jgi:anthranilate phosphoribosyltransferase
MVVHGDVGSVRGQAGMDEISLSGPTLIAEVREGVVREYVVAPEEFGLERAPVEALTGGDAAMNAEILRAIFAGELGPRRDVVVLNAAAVLVTAGLTTTMSDGVMLAASAIHSGKVMQLVEALRDS